MLTGVAHPGERGTATRLARYGVVVDVLSRDLGEILETRPFFFRRVCRTFWVEILLVGTAFPY